MGSGTYEEILPCGGKLKVSTNTWEIYYYFSGPDMRYNGTSVSIPGRDVEQYIVALKENFDKYEDLLTKIPKGNEYSVAGRLRMMIRVGGFRPGVCLRDYHLQITSRQQLEKIINSYRYAVNRVPQIQALLKSL